VLEFLKEQNMSVTPKRIPKSIQEAREMIAESETLEKALQAKLDEHIRLGHKPRSPQMNVADDGKQADVTFPKPGPPLPVSIPAEPKKYLPASCVSPFLVTEHLKLQPTETVRQLLATAKGWQSQLVYEELKRRPN
jgi:hypothetical protein